MRDRGRARAAAYVAVLPVEEQRPGLCLADQRDRLERYVQQHGWELAGVWEDVGADARPARQPALQRLLGNLEGVDKLVIAELRRLGKWPRRVAAILERLESERVDLVALDYDPEAGANPRSLVPRLVAELADGPWWDWRPETLRGLGFAPATMIDVGAGEGTAPLYEAFPQARHVLIEPLAEYEAALARLVADHGGEYLLTAVGAGEGVVTIEVDRRDLDRSAILERVPGDRRAEVERREVPITTLDSLRERSDWRPPFGLKIDTEGFEHEVVRGAAGVLADTEFVIAEVSVRKRFEQSYSFAEFIASMASRGFALHDLLVVNKPPHEPALRYVDAVFARDR